MTEATADEIVSELEENDAVEGARRVNENCVSFRVPVGRHVETPAYEYWYVTDIWSYREETNVTMVQIK